MKLIDQETFDKIMASRGQAKNDLSLSKLLQSKEFKRMPYKFVDKKALVGWSGKARCLYIRENEDALDILHEFCHYLLCAPQRLKRDEFGLGQGFRSNPLLISYQTIPANGQKEEEAVCMLAASFMLHFRLGHGTIKDQLTEQSFWSFNPDDIKFILKRKNQINKRLGMDLL